MIPISQEQMRVGKACLNIRSTECLSSIFGTGAINRSIVLLGVSCVIDTPELVYTATTFILFIRLRVSIVNNFSNL